MKLVVFGNSGSGKTSFSRKLAERQSVVRLSLDDLAFSEGAERRSLHESVGEAVDFIEQHANWIVEGCYADIIEPLLKHADRIIFLNPGDEACIRHCKDRPWEPEKFPSREQQDEHLENLIRWVQEYETRTDEYGLARHRALFESFTGSKIEYNDPSKYA